MEVKHRPPGFVCLVEAIGQELLDGALLLNVAFKDKVNLVFHSPVHVALKILKRLPFVPVASCKETREKGGSKEHFIDFVDDLLRVDCLFERIHLGLLLLIQTF